MKQELKPYWPDDQSAAGERFREAWDQFFSASPSEEKPEQPALSGARTLKIAEVQSRHESALLRYPHVVGVSQGIRAKQGRPTGEPCLVVFVDQKIPAEKLDPGDVLPKEMEGIPIDVVEVGRVEPLPA